jgi:predicted ferric reductase
MDTNKTPEKTAWLSANIYKVLIIFSVTVLLAGALAVPFYYETQTLWYKIGADKVILRTGQLAGLLALVLLMGQIPLALRIKILENLFGPAKVMRWHRMNGVLILCAASSHVFLVLLPEGIDNLPIGKKYWPEMIGGLLFLLLFTTVVTSRFRSWFKLEYSGWRRMHKPLGYFSLGLVFFHVLFVSESFAQGLPRAVLLILCAGLALFIGVIQTTRRISKIIKIK